MEASGEQRNEGKAIFAVDNTQRAEDLAPFLQLSQGLKFVVSFRV